MNEIPAAIALVGLAVIAFVASIRVGMLVGRGIDRAVETRRTDNDAAEAAAADPIETEPGSTSGGPTLE